jgi:opacity protein-like surface antigen
MQQLIARLAFCSGLTLSVATPALAQEAPAPAGSKDPASMAPAPASMAPAAVRRAPLPPSIFRAYGQIDWMFMSASQSFDAILDSSTLMGWGAGGELNVWKGLFFRGAYGIHGDTGTRVLVVGDEVIDLGVPQEIKMKDLTLGGGWRFGLHPRVIAYGGGGFVHVSFSEKSSIFVTEESKSFWGQAVFGGVEIPLSKWLFAGAEVEWRTVADALGVFPSASLAFGETNLGGTALRVLIGIRK